MTEAEWLKCAELEAMLRFVSRYTSRRKERLFAVACCRRVDHLLDDRSRDTLSRLERAVDAALPVAAAEELVADAMAYADGLSYHGGPAGVARWEAANAVWAAAESNPFGAADHASDAVYISKIEPDAFHLGPAPPCPGDAAEAAAQAELLRHIVGNPFRPVALSPAWRTDTVVALARQMYDSRDFSAMPILADALQDAGCDNPNVLDHCRELGPHARGCWVIDAMLDKA